MQTLSSLLLLPLLAAPLDEAPAVHLRYTGNLLHLPRKSEPVGVKRFTVDCLVLPADEEGTRDVFFSVEEQGGTGWAWPERFGTLTLDASGELTGKTRIRLLHEFEETKYPIEVDPPVFADAEKLQAGARWVDGKLSYEVAGSTEVNGRQTWRIDVENNFGRRRSLWVEKDGALVVKLNRRVIMGRGDRFDLTMDLKTVNPLDEDAVTRLQPVVETFQNLQSELGRKELQTRPELTEKQLALAARLVEGLGKLAARTPFEKLATTIQKDVAAQQKQSGDVEELSAKFEGQPAPDFRLTGLDGKPVPKEETDGELVLLHFWDYQGALEEPYGQVGYVDFLRSKRAKLGLKIYGVAVNENLAKPAERGQVLRSIRKLREFMNLSYPITTDDGTLLKKFGDPRRLGAKLPLWVLIDPQGKIVHYRVGFYDIEPNKGLEELDALVIEQIKKQRATE